MPTRPGFARLLPLAVMTFIVGGAGILFPMVMSRRAAARQICCGSGDGCNLKQLGAALSMYVVDYDGGCSDAPAPVPSHGIVDADGHQWELADIHGQTLRGLDLRDAEWVNVDLHGATFIGCDFRECDLAGADLSVATFDRFTRWPAGFDPQAHGALQTRWRP